MCSVVHHEFVEEVSVLERRHYPPTARQHADCLAELVDVMRFSSSKDRTQDFFYVHL
jgi:hypothetical protein